MISHYITIVKNPGCDTYPCYNGGTCVYADGGAKCNCLPGVDGEHCEMTKGIIILFYVLIAIHNISQIKCTYFLI